MLVRGEDKARPKSVDRDTSPFWRGSKKRLKRLSQRSNRKRPNNKRLNPKETEEKIATSSSPSPPRFRSAVWAMADSEPIDNGTRFKPGRVRSMRAGAGFQRRAKRSRSSDNLRRAAVIEAGGSSSSSDHEVRPKRFTKGIRSKRNSVRHASPTPLRGIQDNNSDSEGERLNSSSRQQPPRVTFAQLSSYRNAISSDDGEEMELPKHGSPEKHNIEGLFKDLVKAKGDKKSHTLKDSKKFLSKKKGHAEKKNIILYANQKNGVGIEGYLNCRKSSSARGKRRWVAADNKALWFYKSRQDKRQPKELSLKFATVKTNAANVSTGKSLEIEIISPDGARTIMSAENDEATKQWYERLNASCEALMKMMLVAGPDAVADETAETKSSCIHPELKKLMTIPSNKKCAECNASNPLWASVNLGIWICITCSGIHRSLGSHTSVVRSVEYDIWTEENIEIMKNVGNKSANAFWERAVPRGVKPTPETPHDERRQYICDKYEKCLYTQNATQDEISRHIHAVTVTSVSGLLSSSDDEIPRLTYSDPLSRKAKRTSQRMRKKSDEKRGSSRKHQKLPYFPKNQKKAPTVDLYGTKPDLLKDAILMLIETDDHFRRQLRHYLLADD